MTVRRGVAISDASGRTGHDIESVAAHTRALARSAAASGYIEAAGVGRLHAIESGQGKPLVLIHGSGPTGLLFLPLLERLHGVRAIAIDRPGFGLSDPPVRPVDLNRETAAATIGSILDGLGLATTALLGNSMGGTWALWFALAAPERLTHLILVGAPPLLSVTRVPAPMLPAAGPSAGPPPHLPPPSRESVLQGMSMFEEGETIVRYPDQVDALVAEASDPLTVSARITELRAAISPTGWQPDLVLPVDELRRLAVPTLLIWGDRDPLGGADAAHDAAAMIPDARLEVVPGGHAPWLGNPDRVAELVTNFLG